MGRVAVLQRPGLGRPLLSDVSRRAAHRRRPSCARASACSSIAEDGVENFTRQPAADEADALQAPDLTIGASSSDSRACPIECISICEMRKGRRVRGDLTHRGLTRPAGAAARDHGRHADGDRAMWCR